MSPIDTRRLRRPFVWLLIAQQVVAGAGMSLPCPAATRSGERYPCEHCRCGCQSAEQCWTDCCCFTNQQKVEWAQQNGAAVPEFVVAAAEREAAAVKKPKCPHCDRGGVPQTGGRVRDGCTPNHGEKKGSENRLPRGLSLLSALRCHGLAQQWQAVTQSWPGDRLVELCHVLLPPVDVEPERFARYVFSPSPPPTPPPNAA